MASRQKTQSVLTFPHLNKCGLIEAACETPCCLQRQMQFPHLNKCGLIEATKRLGTTTKVRVKFPHLNKCGLIEATATSAVTSPTRRFPHLSAASLKLPKASLRPYFTADSLPK